MWRLLAISLPVCVIFGATIGFICRGRIYLQALFASLICAMYFAFLAWKLAAPNEWSAAYPIVSAIYQFGPFMLLFFAPAFFAFHRRWQMATLTAFSTGRLILYA